MIPENILLQRGAIVKKVKKNQSIFFEGQLPKFFYQVINGSVKMASITPAGKEFIQGIFRAGQSFGEPVLFIDKPYPATAVTTESSSLLRLSKEEFLKILRDFPDIHFEFTRTMAARLYNKSLVATAISINGPEERTFSVLQILKRTKGNSSRESYKVELSRQQIADMIGFRVETVIRTVKKLEKRGLIRIQKGKILV